MTIEQKGDSPAKSARHPAAVSKIPIFMAAFLLGGLLSTFDVMPFPTLKKGLLATLTLIDEVRRDRPKILKPSPHDGAGLTKFDPSAAQPGYTLVQGLLPGGPQIRMIDMEGQEIHRWNVDFFDIWPEPDHVIPAANLPKSPFNYHTQGFWPLKDGSILANVGDLGSVLLDRCSRPIWTVDRMTHHSVTPAGGGKFWIPAHIPVFETPPDLVPKGYTLERIARRIEGSLKNYNNSIILIDSNGQVEKEFSVLRAVYDAGLEHALYASLQEVAVDPTHINDIEIVTEAFARHFEDVNAGDLLVSIREMHMLAVLDQNDGRLKWHRQGPWVRQHDPDIMPDGTVEIFNNRSKAIGSSVTGSQIVSYDPSTDETRILHPAGDDDGFFSWIMGTHQRLDNGNILIAESVTGRMFEATPAGAVVWDYRLPYDNEVASLFEQGMRVPPDYFGEVTWSCDD